MKPMSTRLVLISLLFSRLPLFPLAFLHQGIKTGTINPTQRSFSQVTGRDASWNQRMLATKVSSTPEDRRNFVHHMAILGISTGFFYPSSAFAKTGGMSTSQFSGASKSPLALKDPRVAFEGLLAAKEELARAKSMAAKDDINGLRAFLNDEAKNLNGFEGNALSVVNSKQLDADDKKAIGTIRRYGSGADVLIMFGGAVSELNENDEPDKAAIVKFLQRADESLSEVILVCQNAGF